MRVAPGLIIIAAFAAGCMDDPGDPTNETGATAHGHKRPPAPEPWRYACHAGDLEAAAILILQAQTSESSGPLVMTLRPQRGGAELNATGSVGNGCEFRVAPGAYEYEIEGTAEDGCPLVASSFVELRRGEHTLAPRLDRHC